MRILEVCTSNSLGGLELYFLNCCHHLTKKDGNEVLALVADKSQIAANLQTNQTRFTTSDSWLTKFRVFQGCIRDFEPDIVHSHNKADLFPIALCKIFNQLRFEHVHTRQMNMPRKKKSPFHRFIYGQVDLLIAITEKLREQILKNTVMDPEEVKVIYYGVPAKSRSSKVFPKNDDNYFKVGLVARIDAKKNQHVLIEALSILKERKVLASAYLIGKEVDIQYAKILKGLSTKYGLDQQLHFTGFMADPISIMPNFDVILLTSEEETFGLVLAEAMRSGVAVIGANSGGVPEIIEHMKTGLLFKPKDPQSLASEIERLILDRSLLKRLATAGKKFADKKFNEDDHYDSLLQTFKRLVNS